MGTSCAGLAPSAKANTCSNNSIWSGRADSAQAALEEYFWNPGQDLFYSNSAKQGGFNYWWQAHAIDVLVDGFMRTADSSYINKISLLYRGITLKNNGFTDGFNDDMGWMSLALLRAYGITGNISYKNVVYALWNTIKTSWDDSLGGGIYWQRSPRTFKDVAANAPACILACRLYEEFGDTNALSWAEKIHAWLKATLVDSVSGMVYDGISITGTLHPAQYTYNYGTYMGACLELYRITKDSTYLSEATRTANVADSMFAPNGIIRDDGTGDGGLFNGIYVRYLTQLVLDPDLDLTLRSQYENLLEQNAKSLWNSARMPGTALFNHDWQTPPYGTVYLSVELSGVMLLEGEALINKTLSGISDNPVSRPSFYSLTQNYPNPFNPSTAIDYQLPAESYVTLEVFNVVGQLVVTLVNTWQSPGNYGVDFTADRFASGVYFYVLRAGDFVSAKKMLFLK